MKVADLSGDMTNEIVMTENNRVQTLQVPYFFGDMASEIVILKRQITNS
jgi:hypothetical protein